MQALHLPTLASPESKPEYSYPSNIPSASALVYTASNFPPPSFKQYQELRRQRASAPSETQVVYNEDEPLYLLRVHTTALTRDELTWDETLFPFRFSTTTGPIPGHDVVGVIEQVSNADQAKFKTGDLVWGMMDADCEGGAAGLVVAKDGDIALAPAFSSPTGANTSQDETSVPQTKEQWEEMLATVPLSAMTAWQALFEHGGLNEPSTDTASSSTGATDDDGSGKESEEPFTVLITGASGSVGVFAVQLARLATAPSTTSSKRRPVQVIAVCSARNADFVRSLGANVVLSYDAPGQQQPWSLNSAMKSQNLRPANLVLEFTGSSLAATILASSDCLRDEGKFISIAAPPEFADDIREERKKALETQFFIVKPTQRQMEKLAVLVGKGEVKGFVDKVFPLREGREAMERVQTKGAVGRGKVVLRVGS